MDDRSSRPSGILAGILALCVVAACRNGSSVPDGGRPDASDGATDPSGTGGGAGAGGAAGMVLGLGGHGTAGTVGGMGGMPAPTGGAGAGGATAGIGGAAGITGAGGAPSIGGAMGSAGATSVGGSTPSCGFVMPNAATAGLPNPASYDVSVAGIVTDRVTGLSWQREVAGQPAFEGCSLNITGLLYCPLRYAAAYCTASRLGGFSDWRLPAVLELVSLVDATRSFPSIDSTAFPDTPYEVFWSSTRGPGLSLDLAWWVSFSSGSNSESFIDVSQHVRCVRTGTQPPPRCAPASGRYQVTGDLVVDAITGLTWQRAGSPMDTSLATATTYCAGLGTGFRVPTFKELLTLIDFTLSPSNGILLDSKVFDRPRGFLWSSTVSMGDSIWVLDVGSSASSSSAGPYYTNGSIKCVR